MNKLPFLIVSTSLLLSACGGDDSSSSPGDNALRSFDFENVTDLEGGFEVAGNVELTDEMSFSGSYSLKVSSAGGGYNRNYISLDLEGTEFTDIIEGRMMIWVDDPGGNGGDFTFVQADGLPKPESGAPENTQVSYRYRVAGTARPGTLMANYDTWIDEDGDGSTDWLTDCWDHSETRLPREQWSCVEWRFDAGANSLEYWFNGERLDDLGVGEGCIDSSTQNDEWLAPRAFDTLHLGIEQYHNGVPPRTMYIDDVILDDEYIGCPDGDYKIIDPINNPEPAPGFQNGSLISSDATFSSGQAGFVGFYNVPNTGSVTWNDEAFFAISAETEAAWHVQLQHALMLEAEQVYTICFDAKAEFDRTVSVNIDSDGPDYASLMGGEVFLPLTTEYQAMSYTFTASDTDDSARVTIGMGLSDGDVAIDNVAVFEGDACKPIN